MAGLDIRIVDFASVAKGTHAETIGDASSSIAGPRKLSIESNHVFFHIQKIEFRSIRIGRGADFAGVGSDHQSANFALHASPQNIDNSRSGSTKFMDTRFLESFVTVVEFGSIAEAGRRLNLTSAGVAQRVRALEAEFGTILVRRVGRHVHPTEAGRAVFAKASQLLQSVRELRNVAAADTLAGELRLGAISTAMTGILPAIVSRVTDRYPNFNIYVAPGTSMDLYKRVVDGDLDAAIVVEPPFRMLKICDWRLMRREPLVLISSEQVGVNDPVRLLSTQPFIRYDRNHWGGRLGDEYLRHINVKPVERFELDALEAIAVMVDRGLGVSLVPDWAPPWPEGLRLVKKVISDKSYMRRIGLVWTRTSSSLRIIEAFLEQATATN